MKKWMFFLIVCGTLAWTGGFFLDRFSHRLRGAAEHTQLTWENKVAALQSAPQKLQEVDRALGRRDFVSAEKLIRDLGPLLPELYLPLASRRAEIFYRTCEEHLRIFIFFAVNRRLKEAEEERDKAVTGCNAAKEVLTGVPESQGADYFFIAYDFGNVQVRLAQLAVSREEQIAALRSAIGSYIKALQIVDDYETKVNLELLIDLNERAKEAAGEEGKLLSPEEFQLMPSGAAPGVAPGTLGKSRL